MKKIVVLDCHYRDIAYWPYGIEALTNKESYNLDFYLIKLFPFTYVKIIDESKFALFVLKYPEYIVRILDLDL